MISGHFAYMGRGFAAVVGAAGEIAKVIQVFQPSGRLRATRARMPMLRSIRF
jgi:hypothetical protein